MKRNQKLEAMFAGLKALWKQWSLALELIAGLVLIGFGIIFPPFALVLVVLFLLWCLFELLKSSYKTFRDAYVKEYNKLNRLDD